jgi:hypothetical protein
MLARNWRLAEATGRPKKAPRPDRWQTGGSAASLHEQRSLSAEKIVIVEEATTWASNPKTRSHTRSITEVAQDVASVPRFFADKYFSQSQWHDPFFVRHFFLKPGLKRTIYQS